MTLHSHSVRPLDGLALFLTSLFSVDIVLSNILSVKLFQFPLFPSMALPCGLLTYPFSFLISDLVNEIYGAATAKKMVLCGFIIGLIACLVIRMALILPPHPAWVGNATHASVHTAQEYQGAFQAIFGVNFILFAGSLTAYILAQNLDIWLYRQIKEKTQNRFLWLQSSASTLISQILDTAIVNIAILHFGLKLPFSLIWQVSLLALAYKLFFILLGIPLFYLALHLYPHPKRRLCAC